ncbi:hypothetical protein QJS10_CPA09g00140 [Acorus calamus]|uniref:GBF-interacting protein 1 N-terminal domain-containing protein n=1 Tax=Acorus calamus TaxID=4465 RepID=A0AAV9E5S4_ACOCL|nr:hypothetical protein QJS10_CPA09g00140 [Acorus calamus]
MVSGRSDGGAQIISVRVRRIIQSIKEIVGDRSDAEIYDVLRETNMDPNETAQKLLSQDPFHEVKRKRDKKKENSGYQDFTESRNHSEDTAQWTRSHTSWDRNIRRGGFAMKSHTGISREFRVVRDNRVKFNADHDTQPAPTQHPSSATEQMVSNVLEKSSSASIIDKKELAGSSDRHMPSQSSNSIGHSQFANSIASHKPLLVEEKRVTSSNLSLLEKKEDKQNSLHNSTSLAPNNYVVGVYSSSSDPVHVPSPNSRSAGKVGAIKREVGVVGGRRKPCERSATHLSLPSSSISVSNSTKDVSVPTVSLRHSVKSSQFGTSVSEPIMPGLSSSRPSSANQYSIKQHQQPLSHQKALQHNMEWKPKSSKKPGAISSRVIGTAAANLSSEVDNTVGGKVEETFLSERLSQVNIENVIIPQHLRVPDTERSQLTFGSFGVGSDSVNKSSSAFHSFGNEEDSYHEPCTSISVSVPESSGEDASSGGLADSQDGQTRTSQCGSPTPPLEPQPSDRIESSLQSMEEYADIGLVRSDSPYSHPEQQKLQNTASFPSFSQAYDPQTSYDMTFFRTVIDENICSQGLTSSSEAVSSHPSQVVVQLPVLLWCSSSSNQSRNYTHNSICHITQISCNTVNSSPLFLFRLWLPCPTIPAIPPILTHPMLTVTCCCHRVQIHTYQLV